MKSNLSMSWQRVLPKTLKENHIQALNLLLQKERSLYTVFPPEKVLFQALNLCAPDKVKVIIVGQDPYHKPHQAHGLAFSVTNGQKVPPSLRNIFKELKNDLGVDKEENRSLETWARQGVLLLNTCLSVRQNKPLSHAKIGWQKLTQAILEVVARKKKPVIFLLWGTHAKKCCQFLKKSTFSRHLVLEAGHPSPLSSKHFFGCKHFSKANKFLVSIGKESIIW